ncbi:MAG: hypothetical protein JNJ41_12775 [Bacteroidia bacterium]|nr:hypothetical protein [Bacteroidia bacterium]
MKKTILLLLIAFSINASAQTPPPSVRFKDGLKIYLSDDSTRYIKGTGLAQIWFRYNQNNPGSVVYGTPKSDTYDAGLRRVRYQTMAQVTNKVFFYSQFGINSLNNLSTRKTGLFLHDVTAEYNVHKNYLVLGGGLSGWNGTSRFSSSSVASILAMDLPTIEETTNDVNDQFVRKLGIYAKGKIKSFDYRLSVANPFPIQNSLSPVATIPTGSAAVTATNTAYFSAKAPEMNYQGYFMWQFSEKESNQVPYMNGSYLGKKRVFNIGSGFQYQKDAMVYRNSTADTTVRYTPLQQFGLDVFLDYYLNKEDQNAVTAYAAFLNYDFGPNYIRNAAVMNTATGIGGPSTPSFNGAGNAFPLIGTGQVIYAQSAYLFKKDLLKKQGTLQPYVSGIYANYQKLSDPVTVYNIGVNWIMGGQNSKLSLDYQSRPIFNTDASTGNITETKSARRSQIVLQYQVAF